MKRYFVQTQNLAKTNKDIIKPNEFWTQWGILNANYSGTCCSNKQDWVMIKGTVTLANT